MRARPAGRRRETGAVVAAGSPGFRRIAVGILVVAAAASGCGPEGREGAVRDRGAGAAAGASSADTVTVLRTGVDERLFGPSHDGTSKFLVFLPLVDPPMGRGGSSAGDATPAAGCRGYEGALAESWEHSEDYRTWTVRLREGVQWHDGEPVTAHDVVFTVELWRHPEVGHYAAGSVDSAVALDERTVRFHLDRPGDWPLNRWSVFYPEHLLAGKDPARFYEWEFWTRPVGNGPFRYVRHVPETMVELEANPDFHRGKPAIDHVRVKFTAAGSGTGLVELRSGSVDLVGGLGLLEAELLSADDRFRVHPHLGSRSTWIFWSRRDPRFRDVRVRRALTRAIDREALHRALGLPERAPVTDAPYTPCQLRRGELADPWPHDPEAARRLLEEAEWRDADGDGVRERDGRPFRFRLLVEERHRRAAVFVQDQLRQVGVRAEIRVLDPSLLEDRQRSGSFEATIEDRGSGVLLGLYVADDSRLGTLPERLVELARKIADDPDWRARESAYGELAEVFRADLPATYLYPRVSAVGARREVRGLEFLEEGIWEGWRWPLAGVEFLWMEEGSDDP